MTTKQTPAAAPPSHMLTLDEVAAPLRVDVRTVRRWVTDGQLPAVKVGRAYLVTPAAVDHFLGSRRVTTASSGGSA